MIPGSKLTDIWGRKKCFVLGMIVYGAGGLLALLSFGLPQLIIGYSLLEGVGSALMIPPIYILVMVTFPDVKSRAKYFGVVSAAAGLGAAAGPLIGGLVTSAISWRASFGLQVLVVAWIILLARLMLTPAAIGILATSASADRFARRHPQQWLIIAGFLATAVGMILLLASGGGYLGCSSSAPGSGSC
jgi:MFS family permease